MIVVITKIAGYLGALLLRTTYSVNMNHVRRTFGLSTVLAMALVLGATQGAVGATYPPVPGSGFPPVPTTIIVPIPPLVPGAIVEIPKAPGSNVVFTLKVLLPTATNLANLLTEAKPKAVEITPNLIMGGILRGDPRTPKVKITANNDAPVELQTKANVPLSVSLSGYKANQTVNIIVIVAGKRVVLGAFKVGANGVFTLPAVTLIGHSTVKFALESSLGTKLIVFRPITSKSKFPTATVKVAK